MDIYDTCACNSGKKYKFCCMNTEIELDIYKEIPPFFSIWGYLLFLSLMAMLPYPLNSL
ncbi:SEC-C metal-binding domain-containing protein [Bacillus toyonensis]|nr:SEC-C metal-binding domain-containing protein [Bacillus toyonensis]